MVSENIPDCHLSWVGVDVGKENLAMHIAAGNQALTVPNNAPAIKAFLRQNPDATIVLESTGGFEAEIIKLALDTGHTVYRVNARRVRAFMESLGIYAKTDAIDAKALADYAATHVRYLHPFTLPAPEMKELRQMTRRRAELIAMRTQETNRLKAPDNACLRASITAVLQCLQAQIDATEKQLAELTKTTEALQEKIEALTAVKGIGVVTAVNLLVAMPELGRISGKQAASLAGLAPFPRDSGKKKGYRRTRGGRVDVRNALYMAALSAARYNDSLKIFYNRLIKNGKRPLQALIATARKLLVILNAKLRDSALISA